MIILQKKSGQGSYINMAAYHGIPRKNCPHGNLLFLPWHRMYIFLFEQALRSIDNTVALPYWDWTSPESLQEGLSKAHSDEEFEDTGRKPNPLAAGPMYQLTRLTNRNPGKVRSLTGYRNNVNTAFATSTNYTQFNFAIEAPHGDIHTWIRGDMGTPAYAAYDPVFWSHHANVDRQWAIWQKLHPQEQLPPDLLHTKLPAFGDKTVESVIRFEEQLKYIYDDLQPSMVRTTIEPYEKLTASIKSRFFVKIDGIERAGESYLVDLFVEDRTSGAETYGGSFGIFGMAGMHRDHDGGHAITKEHSFKQVRLIDITDAVNYLKIPADAVQINLKATNLTGDVVKQKDMPIGEIKAISL